MNGGNRKRYTTTLAERNLLVLGISFFVVRNCEKIYGNELSGDDIQFLTNYKKIKFTIRIYSN